MHVPIRILRLMLQKIRQSNSILLVSKVTEEEKELLGNCNL